MEFIDFYGSAPQKYWQPDKKQHVELDIIDHPEKYSGYIGARKKDGEWSRVIRSAEDVIIQSRSVSVKTGEYGRKEQLVPHLTKLFMKLPKNTVILGELYFTDLNKHSKDVGSILRCLPQKAIQRQKDTPLHFYCFDVLMWDNVDLTSKGFAERVEYFSKVQELINSPLVTTAKIKTTKQIVEEYQSYLDRGGEGYVLQKKDATYVPGSRTAWKTIKLKKATEQIELPVCGIVWPNKEYDGKELENWQYYKDGVPVTKRYYLGYANGVIVNNNGTEVKVTSGVSDEDAAWLASDAAKELIDAGTVIAVVQAMEIEKDSGSLRHPILIQIRTDL